MHLFSICDLFLFSCQSSTCFDYTYQKVRLALTEGLALSGDRVLHYTIGVYQGIMQVRVEGSPQCSNVSQVVFLSEVGGKAEFVYLSCHPLPKYVWLTRLYCQ